jgi:hypothetical protein
MNDSLLVGQVRLQRRVRLPEVEGGYPAGQSRPVLETALRRPVLMEMP